MITMPNQAAAKYLCAIGAAAVYVLADPWGLSRTGVSQQLQPTFDAWAQQHFEPQWVGWVGKLELAHWLADAPQRFKQQHGNISAITWQQVVLVIRAAATISDPSTPEYAPLYTISDHETTIANATRMAMQVRINMDALKQDGALHPFNAAYKIYKNKCQKNRQRIVNYSMFEDELYKTMCSIVALGAEPRTETVFADMSRKFPWLSSVKG